ncbi:MAG TPA: phospholipase D family protein [Ferruginibacter sp.]|jgi:HKD family nuclease|nr:phospholipase D family protein [Ferruginibacter sp.]
MKTTFLGQGFDSTSVDATGNYLIKYLNQRNFHSFTGISAFASEAGIFGLSRHIQTAKTVFKNLSLITGIDQEGTSKEALKEILNLNINSHIFYQNEAPIFHPKIYLFEGDKEIKLIVGSSNLTRRGLFTNVESSLLIEFDITDKEGASLLTNLKTYYKTLFDFSDNNLFKISQAVIDDFNARGIVPNESERKRIYSAKKASATPTTPNTNTVIIPRRATARIPAIFPLKPRAAASSIQQPSVTVTPAQSVVIVNPIPAIQQPKILLWQKLSLSRSDAQYVPVGTNGTGNLKLSQAGFRLNGALINHNTYFRNQVFQNLSWARTKSTSTTYEETICNFDVTILGTSYGIQPMKLSYDPIRISNQANTPSWLHWGNTLMTILQQTNVTGRTLNLYQIGQNFSIEIA